MGSITMKAMPHVISARIQTSSFEKIKVNLAFTLFSEELLKGMFVSRAGLHQDWITAQSFLQKNL